MAAKKSSKKKAAKASKRATPKRQRAPKELFALFDGKGEFCGAYASAAEAFADAWGPRFRSFRVLSYTKGEVIKERDIKPLSGSNQLFP